MGHFTYNPILKTVIFLSCYVGDHLLPESLTTQTFSMLQTDAHLHFISQNLQQRLTAPSVKFRLTLNGSTCEVGHSSKAGKAALQIALDYDNTNYTADNDSDSKCSERM